MKTDDGDIVSFIPPWNPTLAPVTRGDCRRWAKRAHRVQDHAIHPDYLMDNGKPVGNAVVFVRTPRHKWHFATTREKKLLNEKYNYRLWM